MPTPEEWSKKVVFINNKIEALEKPINNTPKTVGEYYQQILSK